MAETSLKRLREETQVKEEEEETKRYKSYNHILSLLDAEEEEPNQDLSSLITSLQQELSSEPDSDPNTVPVLESEANNPVGFDITSSSSVIFKDVEERETVIRHLLEASDDELGIPQSEIRVNGEEEERVFNGGGCEFSLCDRLWEFEDETANYYTLLQSELFM